MKLIKLIKLWYARVRKQVEYSPLIYSQIEEVLRKQVSKTHWKDIHITDKSKMTCYIDTLKTVASLMPVKFKKYQKEVFDCEDFAFLALGMWKLFFPRFPIGLALVETGKGKHALLVAIYKTKTGRARFTYIEPQTNKISHFDYKPYLIII